MERRLEEKDAQMERLSREVTLLREEVARKDEQLRSMPAVGAGGGGGDDGGVGGASPTKGALALDRLCVCVCAARAKRRRRSPRLASTCVAAIATAWRLPPT